jgi:hypothetical protein
MTNNISSSPRKPLRLWPGVALAVVLVLGAYVMPAFAPAYSVYGLMAAAGGAVLIMLWWLLFSRARWYERLAGIVLLIPAAIATERVVDPSIAGGAQGYMTYILVIPTLCVALAGWAAVSRRLGAGARGAAAIVAIVLGCLPWVLLRTGGITAYGHSDFHWRWTPTPEERLLAQADEPKPLAPAVVAAEMVAPSSTPAPAPVVAASEPAARTVPMRRAEWPGFRGPNRDGIVRGVKIATDWSATPPVQVWRRPVGPGWSSFAVSGNLFYTQEQRGGDEVVSCYRLSNGEPVWRHRDATRFWESNGGAGPRGTPTLDNGRVYTLGATGILNVLDAVTGAVIWSRNVAPELKAKIPFWGISSSPLVVDDVVIVAAGGKLGAYDVNSGQPRWSGHGTGFSYSSPHLATIDGVQQVLFISGPGTTSVAPATGTLLWQHAWPGGAIVQPAVTPDGGVLVNTISMNGGLGMRRLAVTHAANGWKADERWTSIGLKPYFNDFVVHKGHAYGFDGNILSCIDLQDGTRKWKGGRYGNGQLVLLADEDLLLVLSEDGDLALVNATPDQFTEVAKFDAVLEGKTWNHPVIVGHTVLVRNDHEMAAYRLATASR